MFGGGNGSFRVAPSPNPFGGSAQASPVNPFQGGGGFGGSPPSGGGFGGFGGSPPSGGGFGNDSTSFGGRGGGRNSFSSRGGRTPSRGGGRSGGRSSPAYQDGTFGTPSVSFGGGRGRGGGRGPVALGGSFDNPFASPAPAPSGFGVQPTPPGSATAFGRGGGRNGGRSGGRDGSGRSGTTFGGAAMAQPNIRRKSDSGGRGPRTPGTMFGQGAGTGTFVPPLPPSSPPPMGSMRKPGRGGIVTPSTSSFSPAATPVSTTFGQQFTGRPKGRIAPAVEAWQDGANPFGASASSTPTQTRTTFGVHDGPVDVAPSSRAAREKRQSNAFSQQSPFQDGFEEPSPLEARMTGMKPRGSNRLQSHGDLDGEATTFGRRPRSKDTLNGSPATCTAHSGGGEEDAASGLVPTLKTKKKTRGTPQASPPPTPAVDASGYQIIGDHRNKAELESAANLQGLCIDMCSPASRQEGISRDDISVFEKCFPGHPGQERELIVKRFQRSSADHKLDIPSEIRPPGVLRRTQLYLEQKIMDHERVGLDPRFSPPRVPELLELYNFCWDRCRMIRKDFVLQNYRGAGGRVHPIAIDVHERIARYLIFSEHELCEVTSFVAQQNIEQLGQTLKSLNELYDESRKLSDPAYLSPFEAEFRGYFILCTLDNGRGSDVLKYVKGLAPQVRETAQVKFAMQVFVARHTQNYYMFFKLLRQATYLQACLVFRYIPSMRSLALERLNRAHRNQPYPIGDLIELLCFDDFEDAEAVCTQHGLDISASEESDGEGEPVVNFGGEFESDIQLRQNKNPLPIRASHLYVSRKKGDILRGEVCRGVTEYAQEDYPALSKLIEDTENAERSAMYPDRPVYRDEFSAFATFTSDPYGANQAASVRHSAPHSYVQHPRTTSTTNQDEQQHELDEIAKKKAEVERIKTRMIERIQRLEREKEEKKRLALESEAAKIREEEEKALAKADLLRKQREAQNKLLAEEGARKQKELELEAQERQRVEAAKAAAEEARLAEQRKLAEAKRQAEEERRQRELQKAEDDRRKKAAAEAERRRQLELTAERERLEREAKRKAELALEAARRKQVQRVHKQRLAILKFRFHSWKNFVARSKTLPRDVIVEATSLVERNSCKPPDVIEWLFGGSRSASDFIGLQRRILDSNSLEYGIYSPPPKTFWQPLPVASIVGQQLHGAGNCSSGWKFVVADLLDDGLSSFGSWCAVKCGISASSIEDDDNVSTVHSTQWSDAHSLGVCCRYLSANFLRSLSAQGREKRLAGTSGIILPLDLSHTLDPKKLHSWEDRVRGVLSHLHPSRRVGVIVLGYCAAKTPRKGDALAAAEASIQRLLLERTGKVAFFDGELVLEEDLFSADSANHKISGVISKLAGTESPQIGRLQVDLSELMDAAVHNALQERSESVEGVAEVQDRLHKQLWQLRDTLLSPSVIDVDIPIPELQATLGAPSYGWNSREAQQKWDAMFKILTSHSVAAFDTPIASSKVCDVYFEQISQLVDAIFSHRISSSVVSTIELKRTLSGLLVPIYEEFLKQGEAKIQGASRLLPWRQIFEHIYSAFIECVDEELLYIPAHLVESIMRRPDVLPAKSAVKRSRHRSALDASAQAAAVDFARRELKRALSDSTLPPTQVDGIKRLRHEIARDKAATQNFQQYLRRELGRWSAADEGFPALS